LISRAAVIDTGRVYGERDGLLHVMGCFTWLLASRPFRRCAPDFSTSRHKSRHRHRPSVDDMVRATAMSGAAPLLYASTSALPVQPLTEREVIVLVQSWKSIQKQFVETGVIMFLRYGTSRCAVPVCRLVRQPEIYRGPVRHCEFLLFAYWQSTENFASEQYSFCLTYSQCSVLVMH